MKIPKGTAVKGEPKISKVQQKLGLQKSGKISKSSNNSSAKIFTSEVKEIFKKDIPNIPKIVKQKKVLEEPVDKTSKKSKKEFRNKIENHQNGNREKEKMDKIKKASLETVKDVKASKKKGENKLISNGASNIQQKVVEKKASKALKKNDTGSPKSNKIQKAINVLDSKPSIPDATIVKAIEVVNQLNRNFQKRKNELFAEETPMLIQIDSIKVAKCTKRKLRFKLPHTLVTDTSDICLFVCDLKRGKKVDHEPTQQHYEDLLREKGVTNIKTVIPIRQVRVEFDQIEMKRRLLTQYDFFLTDARVSGLLAHKLGSVFFKKNQLPTPVNMESGDLKKRIDRALHKTVMRLHGEGTTFSIRIGNGKQTASQICENVQAVLLQLAEQFPGGWNNIRSVHLKTSLSMAIPIYITLKNKNLLKRPVVKPLHGGDDMVEGDLSTLLGAKVQVYNSGKVVIKKYENSDESEDEATPAKKSKLNKTEAAKLSEGKKDVDNKDKKNKSIVPDGSDDGQDPDEGEDQDDDSSSDSEGDDTSGEGSDDDDDDDDGDEEDDDDNNDDEEDSDKEEESD